MTTKEYLRQYRKYNEIVRQIDAEIKALEAEIDSINSVGDGGGHGQNVSNRTERIALRLVEMKDRRTEAYWNAWAKREEIENVILMAPDPIYGKLLYDRYIMFMSWSEITDDLKYSDETHVRGRLHSRALQSVAEWVPNETRCDHDDK